MKNGFLPILLFTIFSILHSCKTAENGKYAQILETKNISFIEDFLKNAHEQDPRRSVLKPRLIALKNAEMKKNASNANKMVARPIFTEISTKSSSFNSEEAEEFKKLMSQNSSTNHQQKTVKLLNALFDQDISSKEAILLVQNNSDCNMILRLEGKAFYNLAIPTHGENSLVLPKGEYKLSSNVCDMKYNSTKKIEKNLLVTLNSPTANSSFSSNSLSAKSQK